MRSAIFFAVLLYSAPSWSDNCTVHMMRDYSYTVCTPIPKPPILPQVPFVNPGPLMPIPPPDIRDLKPPLLAPPSGVHRPTVPLDIPQINQILPRAIPDMNVQAELAGIKTYAQLSTVQSKLVQNLPSVNSVFFEKLVEDFEKNPNRSFEDVSSMTPPPPGGSAMSLNPPKFAPNSDLSAAVAKAINRPLNRDNPGDNDMLRGFYAEMAKVERPMMDAYIASQGQITKISYLQNLTSVAAALNDGSRSGAISQAVQMNGEMGAQAAREDLRDELDRHKGAARIERPQTESLQPVYSRLMSIDPTKSEQARTAKDLGLKAVQAADQAFREGDGETGEMLTTVATAFADIGLGFIPVVGVSRDIYELFSGKSLLTGEELATWERGLAAAGIVTGGVVSSVGKAMKAGTKLGRHVDDMAKVGKAAGEVIGEMKRIGIANPESVNALKKIGRVTAQTPTEVLKDVNVALMFRIPNLGLKFKASLVGSADELNRVNRIRNLEYKDSYKAGSRYVLGKLEAPSQGSLVRVFSSSLGNLKRAFLVDKRIIEGLSPTDVQKTLNLTYTPDKIADVALKSGTDLRFSTTAPIADGFKEGVLQIEIVAEDVGQFATFENLRNLEVGL